MEEKKQTKMAWAESLSKKLAYILRHGAKSEGINIGLDGFVDIEELLSHNKFKNITFKQIQYVVENNDKKRFELIKKQEDNKYYIRASQGHSIKDINDEQLLQILSLEDAKKLDVVVHGTYQQHIKPILEQGLSIMGRNHIHFAIGYTSDKVISGMRKTCDIFIEIDVIKAINDGIQFFVSKNNVILSSGKNGILESKYFKIVKNNKNEIIFQNN
ncbi:hypothetical protein IMG5_161250 [Ichthyophthirius multifiliis]|uniref:2'-phosphotransferase n=1 Tax=Ichthyophthirius multifiliis TaxID=5932 RepID=G0R017_ICHMU|nr:hypothetical protein IMG5_161250 [Ichthyophthirius multifiliis]EGR29175.1 hypothetical protein IMG5_161250 [Ichthyophthirius multifiliis]|eukprot:XP_004030411.1 hypothetical protein IMG5_161250 [Ichthyophthirius multifiliis]